MEVSSQRASVEAANVERRQYCRARTVGINTLAPAVLLSGVFIILGVALRLTNYLVDAEIPARATAWVQGITHSKIVFLLVFNLFLIAVGCLMDIYSAIIVVVPLIVPIAKPSASTRITLG
jgi:C4-dicarboxylate transporter, DctM subunit